MRRYLFAFLMLVALGSAAALVGGATPARAVQPDPLGEFQERLLSGDAYTELANPTTPTGSCTATGTAATAAARSGSART